MNSGVRSYTTYSSNMLSLLKQETTLVVDCSCILVLGGGILRLYELS